MTVNANVTPTATVAGAPTPTPAPTEATGAAGGSVTFTRGEDSTSLDPVLWHNPDIWPFMNVYDQLIKVDDSGTELTPGLAESWDVSDDGLTYTFHLRSGVKFSDGTDMTVDDIVWSIQRAQADTNGGWNFTLMQVKEIVKTDDSTAIATLTEHLGAVPLRHLDVQLQHHLEGVRRQASAPTRWPSQAMGTGPFSFKEWKKSEYVLLAKNSTTRRRDCRWWTRSRSSWCRIPTARLVQLQGGEIDGMIGQGEVPLNRVARPGEGHQPAGAEVPLDLDQLHRPERAQRPARRRQGPPGAELRHRQAGAHRHDPVRQRRDLQQLHAQRRALLEPGPEPYPLDVEKAQGVDAGSSSPDGFKVAFAVPAGNSLQIRSPRR